MRTELPWQWMWVCKFVYIYVLTYLLNNKSVCVYIIQEHVSAVSEGSLEDIWNTGARLPRVSASYSASEIPRSIRSSPVGYLTFLTFAYLTPLNTVPSPGRLHVIQILCSKSISRQITWIHSPLSVLTAIFPGGPNLPGNLPGAAAPALEELARP